MEAYVHGLSTRKADDLVTALGAESGISKSEVSRICAELDTDVAAFNTRDLGEQAFPYVFLDATYCKARVGGDKYGKSAQVVSQAVVIATGVSADRRREVLGGRVGDSETEDFWAEFPRGRDPAGDLRPPPRPDERHRRGHGGGRLAAVLVHYADLRIMPT